jgi:hypothetical protein
MKNKTILILGIIASFLSVLLIVFVVNHNSAVNKNDRFMHILSKVMILTIINSYGDEDSTVKVDKIDIKAEMDSTIRFLKLSKMQNYEHIFKEEFDKVDNEFKSVSFEQFNKNVDSWLKKISNNLKTEEKQAIMRSWHCVASADHKVTKNENRLLKSIISNVFFQNKTRLKLENDSLLPFN